MKPVGPDEVLLVVRLGRVPQQQAENQIEGGRDGGHQSQDREEDEEVLVRLLQAEERPIIRGEGRVCLVVSQSHGEKGEYDLGSITISTVGRIST
eukprot:1192906-Prorocentrum_minimum.AAC.2